MEKSPRSSLEKRSSFESDEKGDLNDVESLASTIQALSPDVTEAMEHTKIMTPDEIEDVIDCILLEYGEDPNFPPRVLEAANRYKYDETLKSDPIEYQRVYEELKVEAALVVVNSPYAEVRAVVNNHDDPSIPAGTFRAWLIGIIFVAAGSFINQFFSIRYPGITVGSNAAQLLAFPAGKLLEAILPDKEFSAFGCRWNLNPGKFNMKEHMVITIMANVGFTAPSITKVTWVQYLPIYYNQAWAGSFSYQVSVALSANFIGYGLAGLARQFLVYPSRAIWSSNLATIAMNRAFHSGTNTPANGWTVSKLRWFTYCFVAMFFYFLFPNYLVAAMSYFDWTTWIAPDNVHLAAITGTHGGLGLNPLPTWDWNQCTVAGDPLVNPFYSILNSFLGTLFTFPIVLTIWYTNTWNTAYLPINSSGAFDNTGARYNVSKALDKSDLFDEDAYKTYSPLYLSAGNAFSYGMFFAVYASVITHTYLYHRREIVAGFKSLISQKPAFADCKDVHSRLMRSYREVPEYVYLAVLVISIFLGATCVDSDPTRTTPTVVLYGVSLAVIFCIPCGVIMSITNVKIELDVIVDLFSGLWFPGNPTAMNYCTAYGYVTTSQALHFAQDLKLAHYVHIPPWVTFNCQMVAILVSTFVCTGILDYQMTQIPGVCTLGQKERFTCPIVNAYFTASVLWGTLGPKKMYGSGGIYNALLWCFLIGALLPIPFYCLRKKSKLFQYFHAPVFFRGCYSWTPYNLSHTWAGVPLAFVFNYYIKRHFLAWWSKYNYITTYAFSCAVALSASVTFFALQQHGIEINWSGNSLPFEGLDAAGPRLRTLVDGEHFGPGIGEF